MKYIPHEYQEYAKEFIVKQDISALFLDCGLGKTIITLTAIWELLLDYFEVRKVLVIAPLWVARDIWPEELKKWEHLQGLVMSAVLGSERERIMALNRKANVYVINRENVEWMVAHGGWDFGYGAEAWAVYRRLPGTVFCAGQAKQGDGLFLQTERGSGGSNLWFDFRYLY